MLRGWLTTTTACLPAPEGVAAGSAVVYMLAFPRPLHPPDSADRLDRRSTWPVALSYFHAGKGSAGLCHGDTMETRPNIYFTGLLLLLLLAGYGHGSPCVSMLLLHPWSLFIPSHSLSLTLTLNNSIAAFLPPAQPRSDKLVSAPDGMEQHGLGRRQTLISGLNY